MCTKFVKNVNSIPNSIHIHLELWEILIGPEIFAFSHPSNLEVNGAYKHCKYEQIWLRKLFIMSNIKVFLTRWDILTDNGQSASQRNMTD